MCRAQGFAWREFSRANVSLISQSFDVLDAGALCFASNVAGGRLSHSNNVCCSRACTVVFFLSRLKPCGTTVMLCICTCTGVV